MRVMIKRSVFVGVSESGGKDSLPPSQVSKALRKRLNANIFRYFRAAPRHFPDGFSTSQPIQHISPFSLSKFFSSQATAAQVTFSSADAGDGPNASVVLQKRPDGVGLREGSYARAEKHVEAPLRLAHSRLGSGAVWAADGAS